MNCDDWGTCDYQLWYFDVCLQEIECAFDSIITDPYLEFVALITSEKEWGYQSPPIYASQSE